MKIMLFDESPERSLFLRMTLERLGHDIVAEISDPRQLYDEVRRQSPDAIIIDTESPSRDTLEHLCLITESCPRPIVMFTHDAKCESIREAVRAGVTAYIVDGLAAERIETAVARFKAFQSVQTELAQTHSKLSERKLVERAKGMQRRTFLKQAGAAALMSLVPEAVRTGAWAAGSDAPEKTEVKIGFIPLTDCASVVMASVLGFDKKYGMKQRVGIARALAMEPKVLLMDEPFSALDALTRARLQDELMRIVTATGSTVVMVTHDVDEAVLLADRVVMMTNGPAATIGEILHVDLPRPRERLAMASNPQYLAARKAALEFLYQKQLKAA